MTTFVVGFSAAVLLVIGSSVACATQMTRVDRALKMFETALHLEISPPTLLSADQPSDFDLQLSNKATHLIEACLGVAREVLVVSAEEGYPLVGTARMIDHPYCERRFKLEPGGHFAWREPLAIPNVPPGPARLRVGVQIVYPRDCDQYGCYATMLRAEARTSVR